MMNSKRGKTTNEHEGHIGFNTTKTDTSFGVRGNCTMCKNTIETAANAINGVQKPFGI